MRKLKKIAALMLGLTLTLGLASPAFAAGEPQRGVLTYTEHIAPQYEDAGLFNTDDGLAPVKKDGKWGYIDKDGKAAIGFQYDYAWRFNEGRAVVAKTVSTTPEPDDYATYSYYMEAEIGFIDRDNHYTPFTYADSDPLTVDFYDVAFDYGDGDIEEYRYMPDDATWLFHNGIALIDQVNFGNYTDRYICSTDGSIIIPQDGYSYLGDPTGPMNEGLIPIQSGELAGYIHPDGSAAHLFDEEVFGPEIPNEWGGTSQSVRNIYYVTSFNQGLAAACQQAYNAATDELTDLFGFIDRDFNWVIQPQYTYWYCYDGYRSYVIFGETGLASVADANGNWGAINKKGEMVIPFQYESLGYVSSGLIMFEQNGKYGYLDAKTYQVAIPAQYEVASNFNSDLGLAAVYDGTKAFLIDRAGNAVPGADSLDPSTYFIPHEDADGYETYSPGTYVVIQKDGKYGYGKIDYLPELPKQSDMTGWAYGEVVEAIEEDLVPVYLQNLYTQNITRAEFCDLIVQTVSEALGKDVETLVLE
ncbi:MAG: WG repeat-containing protein, partial [Oscillospiraceae bacterium]|nr:WG repeat-containing protein [Oscillospiraceae bacterium]